MLRARWCDSFACRLRGLTLRRSLPPGQGLILVEAGESRTATAIHMLLVFFPLGVAWLDASGTVVDTRLARPWRFYVPAAPARYVLEAAPSVLEWVAVGDRLEFIDAPPK